MIERVNELMSVLESKIFTLETYLPEANIYPNQRELMFQKYLASREYHREVLLRKRQQLQTDLELVYAKLAGASIQAN